MALVVDDERFLTPFVEGIGEERLLVAAVAMLTALATTASSINCVLR